MWLRRRQRAPDHWRTYSIVVLCAVLLGALIVGAAAREQITYERFARLPPAEQMRLFTTFSPERKAEFKRAHAERWLASHRAKLTLEQIAVTERAIRFLAPGLYGSPPTAAMRKEEEEIRKQLECTLGRQNATDAFAFLPPPQAKPLLDRLDDWLSWFRECAAGAG